MNRSRRGTYVWLMLMGLAVALVIMGGAFGTATAVTLQVALTLLGAYALVAAMSVANFEWWRLRYALPHFSAPVRMTPAARKATQRAHASAAPGDAALTDIGLIVNERRNDGQWKRHLAQIVAMDEGAIQPYISLRVPSESSNRIGLIAFDLYDQAGQPRLSRQCEQWLRDGDNLIVCDRQLPLEQSDSTSSRAGVWDLRVTLDGSLVAVHNFSVAPSNAERRRRLANEGSAGLSMAVPEDESPVSLEELLKEQRRDSRPNSEQNSNSSQK